MGKIRGTLVFFIGLMSGLILSRLTMITLPVEVLASLWFALIMAAIFIELFMQMRKQMDHEPEKCPKCGRSVTRVHRTKLDRFLSNFIPNLRRYACSDPFCRWTSIVIVNELGEAHSHSRSHSHSREHTQSDAGS